MTAVRVSDQVRPGKHVVRDFDFRRPGHRLLGDASAGAGGLDAMLEQYHYLPGAALAVGENRAAHIGKSDQTPVGESQSVTVGQSRSSTIGINDSTLVGSHYSVTIANGLGGKVSGILGKLLDGSVLGSLGSIASPLLAGPMQQVMGALKKGPFGDTPLTTFMQGPMATLQAVLPGKLQQVASMMSGPLSSVFGAGEQPTSFSMVDKKITLTTGDATIQLEGGKITLSAKEGIFLNAGQIIDLTAGMTLQAQANMLVKIQAGPTPVVSTKAGGGPAEKFAPPVGDLLLVGMKQVEVGAKELLVLGSQKRGSPPDSCQRRRRVAARPAP